MSVEQSNSVELSVQKPAIATDFLGTGRPIEAFAPLLADAGYDTVHWCENWDGDYAYSTEEVARIDRKFAGLGIKVNDLHATEGAFYGQWVSPDENQRKKGVDLLRNRIDMTADLGGQAVILHAPHHHLEWTSGDYKDSMRRSLSEIEQHARDKGIKIALENTDWKPPAGFNNFPAIEFALGEFDPEFLGICYDSGHGNLFKTGQDRHMDKLDEHKDRLIAVHLHDNKGTGRSKHYRLPQERATQDDDMHMLMFTGTVDWYRLAKIMAESGYEGPITSESNMKNHWNTSPEAFLQEAYQRGLTFGAMVESMKVNK